MANSPMSAALMAAAGDPGPEAGEAPGDDQQDSQGDLAGALSEVNAILENALKTGAPIDMQAAGPELEKTMQLMDELSQQNEQGPQGPQGAPQGPGGAMPGPPSGGM